VFNPELQASKFDPKGVYVQRWVPEIANGEPLTQPIVDLKESRNRALAAYQVMSDQVAASS
jgi:deoxyribodipyrimidine photo-lyase